MSEFYAHTKTDEQGNPLPPEHWEPLFTPFGENPVTECQGNECQQCESLAKKHGHLNKLDG